MLGGVGWGGGWGGGGGISSKMNVPRLSAATRVSKIATYIARRKQLR